MTPHLKFKVLFYFFGPKKATEDLEKNKEKGQVWSQLQNSFIVRTDDVHQDDWEWIWQNCLKPWVLWNGWTGNNLFAQHSIQELWATRVGKHVSQNKLKRCSSGIQQSSVISGHGTLWTLRVTQAQGKTRFTEEFMEAYEIQRYPLWFGKSKM